LAAVTSEELRSRRVSIRKVERDSGQVIEIAGVKME
jgi:hypothetical protein